MPEDRQFFEAKNIVTRSVGFESHTRCDIIERKLHPGESIILCSDGLTNMVNDETIAEICLKTKQPEIIPTLIEEAKRNSNDDNVTAMYITITP
jgi:protein phosphatase